MNEELKPCPFCGGEADVVCRGFYKVAKCITCGAEGRHFNGDTSDYPHNAPVEAAAAWNQRTDSAQISALRKERGTLRGLLGVAKCPNCDGSDWEQQQCQWCDAKNQALSQEPGKEQGG